MSCSSKRAAALLPVRDTTWTIAMTYTTVPDQRLMRWLRKLAFQFDAYQGSLLTGRSAWDQSDLDRCDEALFWKQQREWQVVRPLDRRHVQTAFARLARERLIGRLGDLGLHVSVEGARAKIRCDAELKDLRFRVRKLDCIERIGVPYLLSQIEMVDGVPIYEATIFGQLAERPISPHAPLQLAARMGLHRNVFVVGRADCSIVTARAEGPGSDFWPVEIQNRIRPTLRKARITARRVAEQLPEWETWRRSKQDEKRERLEELERHDFWRLRTPSPEEVQERDAICAAFPVPFSPEDKNQAALG